jgi:hypothetical protein
MGYDVDVLFSVPVGYDVTKLERALALYGPAATAAGLDGTRFARLLQWKMRSRPNLVRDAAEDCLLVFGGSVRRFVDQDDGIAAEDIRAGGLLVRTLVEHGAMIDRHRSLLMFQGESKQGVSFVRLGVLMDKDDFDPLPGLPVGCWRAELAFGWGAAEEEHRACDFIVEW